MPTPYVCTYVSSWCLVSYSIYGYIPNLGVNVFFAAFFGVCLIIQAAQGIKYRSWSFTVPFALGCLTECIGYAGRILLHNNVWDNTGFDMQICCLIMAPAFFAAGIYLILMHMVNTLGPQYSPITPIFYPWIFISCDFLSLVLQAAGGATAATASGNQTLSSDGGYVMLAGIVWQVFTLMVFGGLCGAYFQRVYVNRYNLTSSATTVFNSKRFRLFVAAVTVAYTTIFVRCVFRIAELADGWKSPIMQNEVEFIVFDGVMCLIAVLAMTIFCQGQYFPEMQEKNKAGRPDIVRHSSSLNTSDLEAATEKTTVVAK